MTSQAALVNIQRVSKDCALSQVTQDGLDTAEVWGSSPHAPTTFNNLELFHTRFSFSYSFFASIRIGISGSASFQSAILKDYE
jgi:hypothetical protein